MVPAIMEKVYDTFVTPFLNDYVLLNFFEYIDNVSAKTFKKKFYERFEKKSKKQFYCTFGYDGVLKSNKIKTKKALQKDDRDYPGEITDIHDVQIHSIDAKNKIIFQTRKKAWLYGMGNY